MSQEIRNQLPKEIFFSYREGSNGYSCLDYGYEGDVKYIREDVTAELLESEREKSEKLCEALNSLVLSVKAHPDYTGEENDEWTDLVEIAEEALTEYKTTHKII